MYELYMYGCLVVAYEVSAKLCHLAGEFVDISRRVMHLEPDDMPIGLIVKELGRVPKLLLEFFKQDAGRIETRHESEEVGLK